MTARAILIASELTGLLVGALPWQAPLALACSCVQGSKDAGNIANSDRVFAGTVQDIEDWDGTYVGRMLDVQIVLEHVWVGDAPLDSKLRTDVSSSCGVTFEKGTRYIIYGKSNRDYIDVSYCSPTQPYDAGAVQVLEAITGPGTTVAPPRMIAMPTPTPSNPRPGVFLREPESASGAWAFARVGLVVLAAAGIVGTLGTRRNS